MLRTVWLDVSRGLVFSLVTVFAAATICGAVAQTTPEEIEARAAQEKAAREAEILAVDRALPKPFLEVSARERSMMDVPQPEERLVWVTETGLREIRSENPNWPVIDKLLGACANGPPDARVREFAEAVLAVPLPSDPSPKRLSVIERACYLMAQQDDQAAYDLLIAAMVLPVTRLRKDLLPSADGRPLEDRPARRVSGRAAGALLDNAPAEALPPFFAEALEYANSEDARSKLDHLYSGAEVAARIAEGHSHPWGISDPMPESSSEGTSPSLLFTSDMEAIITLRQNGQLTQSDLERIGFACKRVFPETVSREELIATRLEQIATCEQLIGQGGAPSELVRWAEVRRLELLRAARRYHDLVREGQEWLRWNPQDPLALALSLFLATNLTTCSQEALPIPYADRITKMRGLLDNVLLDRTLDNGIRYYVLEQYASFEKVLGNKESSSIVRDLVSISDPEERARRRLYSRELLAEHITAQLEKLYEASALLEQWKREAALAQQPVDDIERRQDGLEREINSVEASLAETERKINIFRMQPIERKDK